MLYVIYVTYIFGIIPSLFSVLVVDNSSSGRVGKDVKLVFCNKGMEKMEALVCLLQHFQNSYVVDKTWKRTGFRILDIIIYQLK